jgi:hypothetical protein
MLPASKKTHASNEAPFVATKWKEQLQVEKSLADPTAFQLPQLIKTQP